MLAELSTQKYKGCSGKVAVGFSLVFFQRGKKGSLFCLCVYSEGTALGGQGEEETLR